MNRREVTNEERERMRPQPDEWCLDCDAPVYYSYERRCEALKIPLCVVCGHVPRWNCTLLGHVALTGKAIKEQKARGTPG